MNGLTQPPPLLEASSAPHFLPVCDHYCGTYERIQKSLQLQEAMRQKLGVVVFDVTLDCEDGAPVGAERQQALMVVDRVSGKPKGGRVGVRLHAVDHPFFEEEVSLILPKIAGQLAYIMLPKVQTKADVEKAHQLMLKYSPVVPPLQALIESEMAVHQAFAIASHPHIQSLSMGLMDFVSDHAGAIPWSAMTLAGQFTHPLVVRAKLEIASACHAFGKIPSHGVVTEFQSVEAIKTAAKRAKEEFGYRRMWSIHPNQIQPIIDAFAPNGEDISLAHTILQLAEQNQWGTLSYDGKLHDRASYRYFWHVLQQAKLTGKG